MTMFTIAPAPPHVVPILSQRNLFHIYHISLISILILSPQLSLDLPNDLLFSSFTTNHSYAFIIPLMRLKSLIHLNLQNLFTLKIMCEKHVLTNYEASCYERADISILPTARLVQNSTAEIKDERLARTKIRMTER